MNYNSHIIFKDQYFLKLYFNGRITHTYTFSPWYIGWRTDVFLAGSKTSYLFGKLIVGEMDSCWVVITFLFHFIQIIVTMLQPLIKFPKFCEVFQTHLERYITRHIFKTTFYFVVRYSKPRNSRKFRVLRCHNLALFLWFKTIETLRWTKLKVHTNLVFQIFLLTLHFLLAVTPSVTLYLDSFPDTHTHIRNFIVLSGSSQKNKHCLIGIKF